jgi:transposase
LRRRGSKKGASAQESLEKQALGRSRGGFSTKIHVLCEGQGLPITVELTPGQQHEATMIESLLDGVSIRGKPGPPRQRFDTVSGDKGYDGSDARAAIRKRGSKPLIPHRKLSNGSYPEGAEEFDKDQYKRRNVVERLIGRIKEFRRVATRYDKLAETFRGFVLLAFIRIWLKYHLSDRA